MKLTRLRVRRMPGIASGFTIDEVGPGLNIVLGPNGIGKTSAMTALRALLWPQREQPVVIDADATWTEGGEILHCEQHTKGQTLWQRAGQPIDGPALPDTRFAHCFFPALHDLLTPSRDDDELKREIARQLAGGYDVDTLLAVGGRYGPLGRPGQTEAKQLQVATQQVEQLRREHAEIAAEEQRLEEKRKNLAAARAASARLEVLRRAAERLDARAALARSDASLAAFPAAMDRLHGDERTRLEELELEAKQADEAVRVARIEADEHEHERARCKLDEPAPSSALAAASGEAEHARTLEHKLEDVARQLRAAEAKREQARGSLGGGPVAVRTELVALDELERLVRVEVELTAERARVAAELDAVSGDGPTDDRRLREAAAALRAWLAAPELGRSEGGVRWIAGVLAGVLFLAASSLALLVHAAWGMLALVAALLGAAAFLLGRGAPAGDPRAQHVRRYLSTRLPPPSVWARAEVEDLLAARESELADAAEARVRAERRASLQAAATKLQVRFDAHAADVRRARETLGIELGGLLSLTVLADGLRRLAAAESEVAELEAEQKEMIEQHAARLRAVNSVLTPFGEKAERAEEARERVRTLGDRSKKFVDSTKDHDAALRRVEAARSRAAARRKDAADLIAATCAADEADLFSRLGQLQDWRAAVKDRDTKAGVLADHERALAHDGEVLALDAEALARAVQEAEAEAAKVESLSQAITRTETQVEAARNGRALSDALAARLASQQALEQAREDAFQLSARRFLLQTVAEKFETESRPQVLQRAMDSFATFTHHAWKLSVDRSGLLRAVDAATGEGRALAELSDGTRTQLLLAVRLAFAIQAERGVRLPFVLDEALSMSDPARFDAVVESLAALAQAEERQLFYLTSQPIDAERWRLRAGHEQAMRFIDLAEIRRAQAAAPDELLRLPPERAVPCPDGDDAAAYAARLGVARLALLDGADAQHPFYLLDDELSTLHRLMTLCVHTIGALKSMLGSPAAARALDEATRARLAERTRWFDAFVDAWAQGRGRPVGRQELVEAGISSTHIDAVALLATRLGGDARALVQALRAGAVRHMRAKTIAEAESWLTERGFIDTLPVLSEDEIRTRVLAVASDPERDAAEIVGRVARWWAWQRPAS